MKICLKLNYSGTFLLRTLWDQIFLVTFCCKCRGFFSKVKNVLVTPVGNKIFVLIMEVFYCVLNLESLSREVQLCRSAYNNNNFGVFIVTYSLYITSSVKLLKMKGQINVYVCIIAVYICIRVRILIAQLYIYSYSYYAVLPYTELCGTVGKYT